MGSLVTNDWNLSGILGIRELHWRTNYLYMQKWQGNQSHLFMKISLSKELLNPIKDKLRQGNQAFQLVYSGDRPDRQPVHTVYGGANLFSYDIAPKLSKAAQNTEIAKQSLFRIRI